MTKALSVATVLMLCASAATVGAQTPPESRAGVAVTAGTFGFGADVAVRIGAKANLRAGAGTFSLSHQFDADGITLDASMKLGGAKAQLDWFPFGGGFHVSPGLLLHNRTRVEAVALVLPNTSFDLGDETNLRSSPSNPVTGTATVGFKNVAPMATIGWGNIVPRGSRRWSVPFELGVVFSSAPTATLNLTGTACNAAGQNCRNIATDPTLQTQLKNEQDQMNDDVSGLKLFPVLSLGFSWKF